MRTILLGLCGALAAAGALAFGMVAPAAVPGTAPASAGPESAVPDRRADTDRPLTGRTVVLDPGHQLGNRNFPRRVNRLVPAGGTRKPCNTTGTSTRGGYPEATLNWQVARLVQRRLERLGARVVLTRTSNRADRWGPCVDRRGRAGNRAGADLLLSIHADGSHRPGARGFHVISARRSSHPLAQEVHAALREAGLPVANYVAGGDGLDVRSDLATLNLSRVPAVMVELGNMRSPVDARRMTRPRGRVVYARALVAAVRRDLSR